MKYIKKFEDLQYDIAFSVGDIVVCIYKQFAEIGTKFKVERIFWYNNDNIPGLEHVGSQIELKSLPESKHDKNHFVTVKNLEGNNTHNSIWSNRFVSESKYEIMKYNL